MSRVGETASPDRRSRVGCQLLESSARLLGVALSILLVLPAVARADDAAEGRRHAQRATHLSASGKCRQAVGEYDKAIAVLHDPALLFNRGECHRKLGNVEAALEDYKQFLVDLPGAPNRAEVEARIVELKKAPSKDQSGATRESAPVNGGGGLEPARAPGHVPVAANDQGGGGSSLLSRPESSDAPQPFARSESSWASRPWLWVAIGAVAVGAGIAAIVVLDRSGTNVPQSDLGNYKF